MWLHRRHKGFLSGGTHDHLTATAIHCHNHHCHNHHCHNHHCHSHLTATAIALPQRCADISSRMLPSSLPTTNGVSPSPCASRQGPPTKRRAVSSSELRLLVGE